MQPNLPKKITFKTGIFHFRDEQPRIYVITANGMDSEVVVETHCMPPVPYELVRLRYRPKLWRYGRNVHEHTLCVRVRR